MGRVIVVGWLFFLFGVVILLGTVLIHLEDRQPADYRDTDRFVRDVERARRQFNLYGESELEKAFLLAVETAAYNLTNILGLILAVVAWRRKTRSARELSIAFVILILCTSVIYVRNQY